MTEKLVEFEVAKLANEKGFTTKGIMLMGYTSKFYHPRTKSLLSYGRTGKSKLSTLYYAPTQTLLQRWLRDKHKLHIEILLTDEIPYTQFYIKIMEIGKYFTLSHDGIYNESYEEVLELGLISALKLVQHE